MCFPYRFCRGRDSPCGSPRSNDANVGKRGEGRVLKAQRDAPETASTVERGKDRDAQSYSEPEKFRVRDVNLDLDASFEGRQLKGVATLAFDRLDAESDVLVLDSRDLAIQSVEGSEDGRNFSALRHNLGPKHAILGAPLRVEVPAKHRLVRIAYTTFPEASGLQWMEPAQTGLRKVSVPFHAIAGDPRAKLDPVAGHSGRAGHFLGAHPNAKGVGRGDGRGRRCDGTPDRLLSV